MNFTYFMSHLQSKIQLQEKWQIEIKSRTQIVEIKRGSLLLYPNEACRHVYFVCSGFFRVFSIDVDIEETIDFAATDDFITCIDFFFNQKRGNQGIICEKDGVLIKLNINDIWALQDLSTDFLRLCNLILQEHLTLYYSEKGLFRKANATQKYLYLSRRYPGISNIVNHKHIASYLGVTAPTLSNLLKSLLRKTN